MNAEGYREWIGDVESHAEGRSVAEKVRKDPGLSSEDKAGLLKELGETGFWWPALSRTRTPLAAGADEDFEKEFKEEKKKVSELQGLLEEVDDKLYDAIKAVREAQRAAEGIRGEVSRVVGGQLDLYLGRTLQAFRESEHQPGSVASLNEFLNGYIEEAEENG